MIKLHEYIIMWKVEDGYQVAIAYVNSKTKTEARKMIRDKLKNKDDLKIDIDCKIFPYTMGKIKENKILLWYFEKNNKEIEEII